MDQRSKQYGSYTNALMSTMVLQQYERSYSPQSLLKTRKEKRKRDSVPGLLPEQLLRFRVMHQNFIQVLLVQNEEVGEPMGHHVGRAPVPAPHGQQAGIEKGGE